MKLVDHIKVEDIKEGGEPIRLKVYIVVYDEKDSVYKTDIVYMDIALNDGKYSIRSFGSNLVENEDYFEPDVPINITNIRNGFINFDDAILVEEYFNRRLKSIRNATSSDLEIEMLSTCCKTAQDIALNKVTEDTLEELNLMIHSLTSRMSESVRKVSKFLEQDSENKAEEE